MKPLYASPTMGTSFRPAFWNSIIAGSRHCPTRDETPSISGYAASQLATTGCALAGSESAFAVAKILILRVLVKDFLCPTPAAVIIGVACNTVQNNNLADLRS